MNKLEKHKELLDELHTTYHCKNHDYGDSFGETYEKLGMISAVTRISDKNNRLMTLCTKEGKVSDESVRDTLMDMANYCIMTVTEMEREGIK